MTKATAKPKVVRAAGGLVWRIGDGGKEIVVVHRPAYDDWSFPKGKLDDGESELQAALREVEEEVSVRCVLGHDLGTISYIDGKGRPKIVRYWEMTVTDGAELRAANEVDDARWVTLADAEGMLTYDHDRAMLDRIRGGPMTGTSISVIRHAEAGDRDRWTAPDDVRPLTRGGRLQAQRIAERFANEPFVQVMSSPFVRCVQTVSPLADAHGLSVELRDDLAEGQPYGYLEKAILEAEGEGPTAICVHGDALRALLDDLIERGIARRVSRATKKGATWVVEVHDGAIVSARHVAAPLAR